MEEIVVRMVGGPGKTGSSTIAIRCTEYFGAGYMYTGGVMREAAILAGFVLGGVNPGEDLAQIPLDRADLVAFRKFCEDTGRDIDYEIDVASLERIITAVEAKTPLVADSKMAARLIRTEASWPIIMKMRGITEKAAADLQNRTSKKVRAVWLTASTEVRARRMLLKSDPTRVLTDAEIARTVAQLTERQQFDAEMYKKYYQVDDYPVGMRPAGAGFGTIIDNSNLDAEETYKQVIAALSA